MTSVSRRALRLARTLAHLHPVQIAFRPVHVARTELLRRVPPVARRLGSPASDARPGPPLLAAGSDALPAGLAGLDTELGRARRALQGSIEAVGREWLLAPPHTDFAPAGPRLARYQLGYLGIARSLAVAARAEGFEARPQAAALAVAHVREFLERVPPGRGDAWDPYVVATRILNLVVARELLLPAASPVEADFLDGPLVRALAGHARWLSATLELHLLGNHLFTDGAALFVAGCALQAPGAAAWRALGRAIIGRSLATDLLGDGGHAERSPMYGALYLDQLSLALAAGRARGAWLPEESAPRAAALARQLLLTAHPDGDIPLLGDSAFGEAPRPADVAGPFSGADSLRHRLYGSLTEPLPPVADGAHLFAETGVAAVRAGADHLVVEAGPLGAPDQPGHAHSDTLSFEWTHRGARLVVDAGAGHYEADEARAYFRGPTAHSAVSVGGSGADELWAAFRAGARGVPGPLELDRAGVFHLVQGCVRAPAGWLHRRIFVFAPGRLLFAADAVTGATAPVRSHLHFAPGARVTLADGRGAVALRERRLVLHRVVGAGWRLHAGERSPFRGWSAFHFGRFQPSPEVEIDARAGAGATAAWALVDEGADASLERGSDGRVCLRAGESVVCVELHEAGWRRVV